MVLSSGRVTTLSEADMETTHGASAHLSRSTIARSCSLHHILSTLYSIPPSPSFQRHVAPRSHLYTTE